MIRYCSVPGCWRHNEYRGRCYLHSKEHDRSIDRAGRATYNKKRWQITRERKLSNSPVCEDCHIRLATVVHHKQDIAQGGKEWDMANLQALCSTCHNRETRHRQVTRSKDHALDRAEGSVLDSGRGK